MGLCIRRCRRSSLAPRSRCSRVTRPQTWPGGRTVWLSAMFAEAITPRWLAAQLAGIRLESFPSMLAVSLLEKRRSLVVAGTHGKTTTSSLLTWMLRVADRDPSWMIGGVPQNLGRGFHLGEGEVIVLEGDEYNTAFFDKKSKFLHYRPQRAILTSVEYDHADIFDSYEQVRDAFVEFVKLIPKDGLLVVDADSHGAMEGRGFGRVRGRDVSGVWSQR